MKLKKVLLLILIFVIKLNAQTATLQTTFDFQKVNGINIPFQNGIPLPSFEKQSGRTIIDLSGEWKKFRFVTNDNLTLTKRDAATITSIENESGGKHLPNYDDSNWQKKNLPGVENTMIAPADNFPEFYNDGIWYRRTFNIDASHSNKFVKLMFYAVNYVCDIWINGKYVGYHEGGYTPFAFDVSSFLNYGSQNLIAIRVDNIAWGDRKDIIPFNNVDWFNYAGVIHDLYLEVSDKTSLTRANIIPKDIDGNFSTTLIINNNDVAKNAFVKINVYEASINSNNIKSEFAKDLIGKEILINGTTEKLIQLNEKSVFAVEFNHQIPNPKLWTMKNPNLYVMKITLQKSQSDPTILDEYYTQFGIRTVKASKGKFILNNKIMFLPGVARHEEHPTFGRSVTKDVIFSDLLEIKNLNALYLRTAHYPNHLYTYLIADRLGIGIMEEIPVWQWDSKDVYDIHNSRKLYIQMFREMVFKDFNRPSVFMWSTSNECHWNGMERLTFNNNIKTDYRTNYDDGRLLTQSAAADNPGWADQTQTLMDVAGWTIYFGIFYGKSGQYTGPTFSFVNSAQTNFPDKPIIDTEFGYWSSENGSTTNEQVKVLNETFTAFKFFLPYDSFGNENPNGNLMGTTWWCVYDWYQNKQKKNGWQTMGLIGMDRITEKPVAAVLRSTYLPFVSKEGIPVNIENNIETIPTEFELYQNYPNPFNPETTIKYSIPQFEKNRSEILVTLKVYDVLGKEVATLVNENQKPGNYNYQFSMKNLKLGSGVYFYELKAGNYSKTLKMLYLK
ncbi:MAG: T9SS type A sorting domain-containing protein [Melioribacteraceae bacterium]|nr:T9SS type A sorting domain-containing protein [Melioribacteraceae bacterium]